jgi:hypothetical protein
VEGFGSVVTKRPTVACSEIWGVKCREVQWSEVKRSKMKLKWRHLVKCVHRWFSYAAACGFCAVRCLCAICFSLLCFNYSTYVLQYSSYVCFLVLYVCFLSCVFRVFLLFLLLYTQVYRPLPPGHNPISVNKYRVIEKDGIWNRYNLKSTGRIYTFGVLKCSEKFKVLDLP